MDAFLLLSVFLALFPWAVSAYFCFLLNVADPLVFAAPLASLITLALFRFKRKRRPAPPPGVALSLRNLELLFLALFVLANTGVISSVMGESRKPVALLLLLSGALAYLARSIRSAPFNPSLGFRFPWIRNDRRAWLATQRFGSLALYFSAVFPPLALLFSPEIAVPLVSIPVCLALLAVVIYSLRFWPAGKKKLVP